MRFMRVGGGPARGKSEAGYPLRLRSKLPQLYPGDCRPMRQFPGLLSPPVSISVTRQEAVIFHIYLRHPQSLLQLTISLPLFFPYTGKSTTQLAEVA